MLQAGVGQYPCAGVRGQHWAGEGGFTGPREGNFTGPRERNITGPRERNITGPREGNITGPREGNITRPRERNTHGALRSCGNSALLRKARLGKHNLLGQRAGGRGGRQFHDAGGAAAKRTHTAPGRPYAARRPTSLGASAFAPDLAKNAKPWRPCRTE